MGGQRKSRMKELDAKVEYKIKCLESESFGI